MVDSKLTARLLFGTAALAALGFIGLRAAVARGKTARLDRRAQRSLRPGQALQLAAKASTPLGKWWGQLPAALVTAKRLQAQGRGAGALTVLSSSVGAILLSRLLERSSERRAPPRRRGEPWQQSFPSGHALQSSALAATSGYVLWREGFAPTWSSAPLGVASLAAGAGRLLLARHWSSDVLAGYCAGLALSATCAGMYELARAR